MNYLDQAKKIIGGMSLTTAFRCESLHRTTGNSREFIAVMVLAEQIHELRVLELAKDFQDADYASPSARWEILDALQKQQSAAALQAAAAKGETE